MIPDRLREIRGASLIFLLAVIFAGLVNIYLLFQFRRTQHDTLLNQVSVIVSVINSLPPNEDSYRTISRGFNLARLVITDTTGRFVYDTFLQQGTFEAILNVDRAKLNEGKLVAVDDGFASITTDASRQYRYAFIYLDLTAYEHINRLARWQFIYLIVSLVFIAGLGIFLVLRALRPIDTVLDRITDLGISTRQEDFLRQSFDEMLSRLRKKEEEIQRLASLIAHEFRNSLAAIAGLVRSKPQRKNTITLIDKELRLMESLIKHIIDFTRPMKLNLSDLSVNGVLEDILSDLRPPRGVKFRRSLDPDLPEITGDWELLTRAFSNVIKNALEAKPKEHLTVATRYDDTAIMIELGDDGVGITPEDLDRVFYPFFSSKEGGIGLGLPFVRKVVELHDGTVEMESKPKVGTTVRIRIPRIQKT